MLWATHIFPFTVFVVLCYACLLPFRFSRANKMWNECVSGAYEKKEEKWKNSRGKTARSRHVAKTVTTKLVSVKMSVRETGTGAVSNGKKWIVWLFTCCAPTLRARCDSTEDAHYFQEIAPAQNMSHSSLRIFPFWLAGWPTSDGIDGTCMQSMCRRFSRVEPFRISTTYFIASARSATAHSGCVTAM